MNTLFASKVIEPVMFEDGRLGRVTVRQLRLREYPEALRLLNDEFKFNAFCCQVEIQTVADTLPSIANLHPESYEAVNAAVRELNQDGFFIFAARQEARAAENLRLMPKEMVEKFLSQMQSRTAPRSAG